MVIVDVYTITGGCGGCYELSALVGSSRAHLSAPSSNTLVHLTLTPHRMLRRRVILLTRLDSVPTPAPLHLFSTALSYPLSVLAFRLFLAPGRSWDDLRRRQHTDRRPSWHPIKIHLRGKSPDTAAESASLKGQSLHFSSFWRRRLFSRSCFG